MTCNQFRQPAFIIPFDAEIPLDTGGYRGMQGDVVINCYDRAYSPLIKAAIICSSAVLARSVTPEASKPPKG